MAGLKLSDLPVPVRKSGFGDITESRALLGAAMKGKRIVFVVDDIDHHLESIILKMGVFEDTQACERSGVMKYSEFFAGADFNADALILRSSRRFPIKIGALSSTLSRFREQNPKSAVVLCAFDGEVYLKVLPLLDSGVINALEANPPNDFELLRKAAAVLEKLASQ
ncbi:MAG: hypothetical protein V1861_01015 [Candidatus Micrarchaeota archaeon]